jgi:hypothetical protein
MARALTRAAPYFILTLMYDSLIETWRRIIISEHKSWALFSNGERDLDAAELMVIHVEDNRGVIMQ